MVRPPPPPDVNAQRTIAKALETNPFQHDAIISAYAAGADTALKFVAAIVAVAGALVSGEMMWAGRRSLNRAAPDTNVQQIGE